MGGSIIARTAGAAVIAVIEMGHRAAAAPRCACASRPGSTPPQASSARARSDIAPRRVERDADLKPVVAHGASLWQSGRGDRAI
jgi:hypothetical protein